MVPPLAPPPSEAADPPSEAPEPPELPAPSEPPPAAAGAGSEQAARALSGSSSPVAARARRDRVRGTDRKSTRLNSSHVAISYAVFCLKTKKALERRTAE